MQQTNVLLLFGGESPEHEVSIASAKNVYAALIEAHCNTTLCYIDKAGKWWWVDSIQDGVVTTDRPQLVPQFGEKMFTTVPGGTTLVPDVIFPVLHGINGVEDGAVQGIARMLHIPIVGSEILAAAITMDKDITKRLLRAAGLPVVDWLTYTTGQALPDYATVSASLGETVFVKPARTGSSYGVSKVQFEDDYAAAIEEALKYDQKVLIERAVEGRELEVAVMGNHNPQATKAGEVKPKSGFYDYYAKYDESSQTQFTIPAKLSDDEHENIRTLAIQAYQILGCSGLARVDFFLSKDGAWHVNEINSLPGFATMSVYPMLWRNEGVTGADLVMRLINYAKETIT